MTTDHCHVHDMVNPDGFRWRFYVHLAKGKYTCPWCAQEMAEKWKATEPPPPKEKPPMRWP